MRIRPILLSLSISAASLGGCGSFGKDRALDFAQSFEMAAGWSEGLEVNVRATKALQAGIGAYRGVYWAGLKDGVFDVWEEERSEFGIGPLYLHEVFRARGRKLLDIDHPLFGDPGFRERSWDVTHLTDRGWFDFGATATVALFGLNVAFKGTEFADFCAGCCGFDPLHDDVYVPTFDAILDRIRSDDGRLRATGARALLLRTGDDYDYALYTAAREFPWRQQEAVRRIHEDLGETPPMATSAIGESPASP